MGGLQILVPTRDDGGDGNLVVTGDVANISDGTAVMINTTTGAPNVVHIAGLTVISLDGSGKASQIIGVGGDVRIISKNIIDANKVIGGNVRIIGADGVSTGKTIIRNIDVYKGGQGVKTIIISKDKKEKM